MWVSSFLEEIGISQKRFRLIFSHDRPQTWQQIIFSFSNISGSGLGVLLTLLEII